MKKVILPMVLSMFVGVTASQAQATNHDNDVVRDFQDHIIKNSFNNCVITKWKSGYDSCHEPVAPKPMPKLEELHSELLNVYFNFDSDELTPSAQQKLQKIIGILTSSSQVESVDIVGYADYIGDYEYNRRLSQDRTNSVRAYLQSNGYVNTRNVSTQARGEDEPAVDCSSANDDIELKACLWRDRRVEIKLNYTK